MFFFSAEFFASSLLRCLKKAKRVLYSYDYKVFVNCLICTVILIITIYCYLDNYKKNKLLISKV